MQILNLFTFYKNFLAKRIPILDFITVSIYEYVTKRRENESKGESKEGGGGRSTLI